MRRPVVPLNAWSRTRIPDPVIAVRAVDVAGQRVFVRTYTLTRDTSGRPLGAGGVPVIVLVHGIGVSARYFIPLANALADFADILMLDLPGFSTLPAPKKALGIEGFAEVLRVVLDEEKIHDPVLLGHSMGAQVVVQALAADPHLAGRVLLLGPPVNAAERSLWRVGTRFIQSSLLEPFRVGMVAIPAYITCGTHWFFEVLPALLRFPVEERISGSAPVTVLVRGEHDYVAPAAWLHELAEASGGVSEIHTVTHAAHSVMFRHHDAIAHRLVQLAATPSPLGGNQIRESDVRAVAAARGYEAADRQATADLLEELLPTTDGVPKRRGQPALWLRAWKRAAGWWHTTAGQALEGVAASIGSGQWRHVAPGDYAHSLRREARLLASQVRGTRAPSREQGSREGTPLTPYPVYVLAGMTQTWRVWEPLIVRLREAGCDVRPLTTLGRSLGSVADLARHVEDALVADDATNAVLVAHSKGGLVAKRVLTGPHGARVRRVIAVGTPWSGSTLAGLAPWWGPARMMNPRDAELADLAAHPEVNGRIWTVSASFDEQVPDGTSLDGARDWRLQTAGHNRLTDSDEALAAIMTLIRDDAST